MSLGIEGQKLREKRLQEWRGTKEKKDLIDFLCSLWLPHWQFFTGGSGFYMGTVPERY